MNNKKTESEEFEFLRNEIRLINDRLIKIEGKLANYEETDKAVIMEVSADQEEFEMKLPFAPKGSIEFGLGQFGMAWLGNIVLFFGIIFLSGYLQKSGYPFISLLAGFTAVGGIYAISRVTNKSYAFLSALLEHNAILLLYYFILRLHFFQKEPLIKSETAGLMLLIFVSVIQLWLAYRKESQLKAGIALIMLSLSGIFSTINGVSPAISLLTSIAATFLYHRFGWLKLTFFFIFLTYFFVLNWLLGSPLTGHKPEFMSSPGIGYFLFILMGFVYSLIALITRREMVSKEFVIAAIVWNGVGFTLLLATIIFTYFSKNYVPVLVSITLFCLAFAIALKLKAEIKILSSFYVLYGFMALSIVLFGIFSLPQSFALFALQSLLVLSFALWFRSQFIVIINAFLFLFFLGFYLKEPQYSNFINFTFLLVAYISARIINWKKERLNIKTEMVRNLYLFAGLIMTLVSFYHVSLPPYRTVSWMLAALILFVLSIILKNIKYRWLAIAVVGASAMRLVIVDMSTINVGLRVLVFMLLAIFSITVSILYTKFLGRKND
jgi:hypothetical protein